jgi:hypothetical protein
MLVAIARKIRFLARSRETLMQLDHWIAGGISFG